jgi:hypothetical protein
MDAMNKAIEEGGGGGGGEVKIAKVTVTVNAGTGVAGLSGGLEGPSEGFAFVKRRALVSDAILSPGQSATIDAVMVWSEEDGVYTAGFTIVGGNPNTTGDCEIYDDTLIVLGDCGITLDPVQA